jgi:hypothetical protein
MRWCPGPDSKLEGEALDYMLEGALESADDFLAAAKTVRSLDDRIELMKRRFVENDLVIAVWWTASDELEWLPVKGAELLVDPSLIDDKRVINFAGIPCANLDHATELIQLARASDMLPGTIH